MISIAGSALLFRNEWQGRAGDLFLLINMDGMKHLKWYILLAGCLYSGASLFAQGSSWHSPVEIPCLLSGSFGEPRPNHFHCGIDVKTQGVVNKRILAVGDGYVSRMTVGKNGFGNALYVTHPNGLVSVYCHLNDFVPALHQLLRQQQYKEQNDEVDVRLQPGCFSCQGWYVDCL